MAHSTKTQRVIANVIVWLEDLNYAIDVARFKKACELTKTSISIPRLEITKVIDREGSVVATLKNVVASE